MIDLSLNYISPRVSVMQIKHFNQLITSGEFQLFDYGSDNVKYYNSKTPPDYQLSNIIAPVHLYAGSEDSVVSSSVRIISMTFCRSDYNLIIIFSGCRASEGQDAKRHKL